MSFSNQLKKFNKDAAEAADRTVRAIKLELFSSIIMDTPVDTGRARGNWQTNENSPKSGEVDRADRGSAAISEAESNLGHGDCTTYMTNNLPYIEQLENGSGKGNGTARDGFHMVAKNIARIEQIVKKSARKERRR